MGDSGPALPRLLRGVYRYFPRRCWLRACARGVSLRPPAFSYLSAAQYAELEPLFVHMLAAQASVYPTKEELLFHCLMLGLHALRQLLPPVPAQDPATGTARLTAAFQRLLADQFPIVAPTQTLRLRTPQDYADRLGVYVNSLNRALKQGTGKTTSELLSARRLQEALALQRHTDWPTNFLSCCLSFSEPTHFTAFCRRTTGYLPSQVHA